MSVKNHQERVTEGKSKGRLGQVLYCLGIALALVVIAFAAESYRNGGSESEVEPPMLAVGEIVPSEVAPTEEAPALRTPEGGEVLREWSETPAWNAELGLWESHEAVDYRLKDDAVVSLCAGTVRSVGVSGALGGYVEVACGELLLRYGSVKPAEGLKAGDALQPGDLIGTADASLPGESALGHHLHLEVVRDGEALDFVSLLTGD